MSYPAAITGSTVRTASFQNSSTSPLQRLRSDTARSGLGPILHLLPDSNDPASSAFHQSIRHLHDDPDALPTRNLVGTTRANEWQTGYRDLANQFPDSQSDIDVAIRTTNYLLAIPTVVQPWPLSAHDLEARAAGGALLKSERARVTFPYLKSALTNYEDSHGGLAGPTLDPAGLMGSTLTALEREEIPESLFLPNQRSEIRDAFEMWSQSGGSAVRKLRVHPSFMQCALEIWDNLAAIEMERSQQNQEEWLKAAGAD